jgi:hypothetical protein
MAAPAPLLLLQGAAGLAGRPSAPASTAEDQDLQRRSMAASEDVRTGCCVAGATKLAAPLTTQAQVPAWSAGQRASGCSGGRSRAARMGDDACDGLVNRR